MKYIDINSDLGEGFGSYEKGNDEAILSHVTSANIACGWHAGDALIMQKTVEMCKKNHVSVGAHPGFLDLIGFGRREMICTPEEVTAYVKYQIGALYAFAKSNDVAVSHIKPHGALYNMAVADKSIALAICRAIAELGSELILLAPFNSQMMVAANEMGLRFASEVFADRAYNQDGSLVKRGIPGAMITDSNIAVERALKMVSQGIVETINGKTLEVCADSICVHGDTLSAVNFVKELKECFLENGIIVKPFSDFVR